MRIIRFQDVYRHRKFTHADDWTIGVVLLPGNETGK